MESKRFPSKTIVPILRNPEVVVKHHLSVLGGSVKRGSVPLAFFFRGLLVVGCWLLVVDCWLLVVGC